VILNVVQKVFILFFQFFERVSKCRASDKISLGQHSHVRK